MNSKLSIFSVVIICVLGTLTLSCKKDPPKVIPTLTTTAASNITSTSVSSGGTISNDGDSPVISRGVCWGTNQSPTINESKTSDGAGIGTFTSSINELLPGGTYYVRAYAINAVGTAYGAQISILTKSALPILTSPTLLGISSTSASVSGIITSDGGATVISRGVCWSRKPMPSNNWVDSTTVNGTGTGAFTSSISGLKPGTTYYIRAYAINSIGNAFSDQIIANTVAVLPELSTTSISNITTTTATSGGNITYDGGASIISRGVCWSNNQSPSISDNKTNNGSGTGNYISNISGLSPGKTYYVRAYATNNIGTSYGNQVTFTSTSILPILTTTEPSSILSTSATSGGNITSDGGAAVTTRGVCWNSNGSPTIDDSKTTNESGVGSFISTITGLMPNTTYKIRAYATNSVGTSYGNQVTLTTLQGVPTIITSQASSVTQTSITTGGILINGGGSLVISKGVCYSRSQNPTINDRTDINWYSNDNYICTLTNLEPKTTYYIRAFATNLTGTGYGNQVTATTLASLAKINTNDITNYTSTTAVGGGNITSDGGEPVTLRGICWNTKGEPIITDSKTTDGSGTGVFSSSMLGLTPSTKYYVRAYATNSIGTIYGNQVTVTTLSPEATAPVLTTTAPTEVTSNSLKSGGILTSDGGSTIFSKGICYSRSQNPTINDRIDVNWNSNDNYVCTLINLEPKTTYYIRAFATNLLGTGYGNQITVTTLASLAKISTNDITNYTSTTAVGGGNITGDGGEPVTLRGVCWNTKGEPIITDSKTTDGLGIGIFSSSMIGLTPNTKYYVRAYATNSIGTVYGNQVTVTTLSPEATVPVLTTTTPTEVTSNSLKSGGILTSDGGSLVFSKGLCYSRSQNPTINDEIYVNWNSNDNYVCTLTSLEPKTTYYIRAFATNLLGTGYGNQVTVTTLASLAKISTNDITNYTTTTAVGGGNITSDGGEPVTLRGVCWNTNGEPIITDSKTTDGSGIGVFSSSMLGLTPSTKYYVRAYATNSIGTEYGIQVTVTTLSSEAKVPVLTTTAPTEVTSNSLKSGGILTSDGGSLIFSKGVCYSRSQNPTINDENAVDIHSNDNYICTLTNLQPKTTYYIRAFATNLLGTGYGNQITVTTLASLAKISTNDITNYTLTTAVGGGNITSDGGEPITLRGVCWNTNGEPIITDSKTTNGSGTGVFSSSMSGLTPSTKYYVRAYATNSIGTVYGNQVTVTTLSPEPTIATLITSTVSNITSSSATSGGSITNTGGSTMISRGVCYSRSQNPTKNDMTAVDIHSNDNYVCTLTNLQPKTTYYIRAFATNTVGTAYGNQVYFTTKDDGTVIVGSSDNIQHIDASGNFVFQLNNLVNKNVYFIFSNKNTYTSKNLPTISSSVVSVQMAKEPVMDNKIEFIESGTPSISDFNNNPWKYRTTGITKSQYQQYLAEKHDNYTLGTNELFTDEKGTAHMSTVRKVISAHSKTLYVWVDDQCWGPSSTKKHYVTQAMIDAYAPKFLNSGTNDDIYEWVTNICGAPWGVTSNNNLIPYTDEIHIWFTDIYDDNLDEKMVIGYFGGVNNYLKSYHSISNEKIMFVLDAVYFAAPEGGTWNLYDEKPEMMISTLAHEFQHMIYYYQKTIKKNLVNDNSAMTEMLSLCVEDLVANKIQSDGPRGVAYGNATAGTGGNESGRLPKYNEYNDLTLLNWPNNDWKHYAKAYALGAYLIRNYGGAKLVKAMVQNGYVDYNCIVNAVNANGGVGITFENILKNFGAANILSDRTTMAPGYKYNTGTWFTSSLNSIDYKLGSINLYNYSPNPKIHSTLPSIQNAGSNVYYLAGSNLSGTKEWSFTGLNSDIKLTVIIK